MSINTYEGLVSFPWDYWLVRAEPYTNYEKTARHIIILIVVKHGISYEVVRNLIFASTTYAKLRYKHNDYIHLRRYSNSINLRDLDSSGMTKCNTLQDVLELLERLIMLERL